MSTIKLVVPDIGDFSDVEVIEILVNPGDTVAAEQSLITVESDKASMEIPASAAGRLVSLAIKLGDKVSQGSVIGEVEADGAAAPAAAAAQPAPAAAAPSPAAPSPAASSPAAAASPAAQPAAASAPAGGGSADLVVPDIGDFKDVEIIEIFVKPGDTIAVEQSLITVESDKASMEIPASVAGVLESLAIKVGDKVSEGSLIGKVTAAGAGAPAPAPAAAGATPAAPAPAVASPAPQAAAARPAAAPAAVERAHPVPAELGDGVVRVKPHASPSVRKLARELGADLTRISGSAPKGRITENDVKAFVKGVMTQTGAAAPAAAAPVAAGGGLNLLAWPKVDFAKFGPIDTKPLSRIKKISGANLSRNWVMIPHVTNNDDADITDLEAFRVQLNAEQARAKSGVKVTMLAFLIKACVAVLKKYPEFNTSLEGDSLVYKQYYHIGFAADTPNGLVVPVIQNCDKKGLFEISVEMSELAAKARDGKLSPTQMQGGCFSISSLGGIGGTYFTPIINAPEVAILGVCRSVQRPVWDEAKEKFVPRLILPLSLSFDHRVIDGAAAARFNSYLIQLLGDFRRILL